MRTLRVLPPALLALLLAPGCLSFEEPDLFPVCEDRRADGPSPPYTVDELARQATYPNGTPDPMRRLLAESIRDRVLTLRGEPYRGFSASFEAEGEDRWRFRANGTAPLGGVADGYDLQVTLGPDGPEVEDPRALAGPVGAPPSLEALGAKAAAREEELVPVFARTPRLVASGLDPALPACIFLRYEGEPPEGNGTAPESLVVVNLVRTRVVHLDEDV